MAEPSGTTDLRRPRWRRVLAVCGQVALGLGVGAALTEYAFRVRDDGAFPHVNFYLADRELGVRLEPGASMRFRLGDNPLSTIHVNSAGFRGPEWPPPATSEIVVVGDSQVFGLGVDDDATFSARLAAAVDRPVVNAGVPTYGPREYLAVAHNLLDARKPTTVVVVLNFVNDPFELERPNRERHVVWDGWAVRRETAPRSVAWFPGRRWLFSRSHAFYALRRWLHDRDVGDIDDIDAGTPSEGGLQDLIVDRSARQDRERASKPGARTSAQAAARLRKIDADLKAAQVDLDAIVGRRDLTASSLPGDIVSDASSESSRSVVATAAMIRAAAHDRAARLVGLLDDERLESGGEGPIHRLIAAQGDLAVERGRLRQQLATGVAQTVRPASLFRAYLAEFKAVCDQLGAELVVVALPIDVQVDRGEWAKYGVVDGPDMQGSLVLVDDLLADARDLGLRTLDATAALRAAQPGAFLDHDIHMTAKGHAAVATALAATLTAARERP